MNKLYYIITLLLVIIAFMFGATYGASKSISLGLELAEKGLDIKLSERAKDIIINNPEILNHALTDIDLNYTNPFINHSHQSAAPVFEYCMLTSNNYQGCYDSVVAKYGKEKI